MFRVKSSKANLFSSLLPFSPSFRFLFCFRFKQHLRKGKCSVLLYNISENEMTVMSPHFSTAHWCYEPQEGSILFRQIWVLGGWSGAEIPLWHPLFHLQLHPDMATAYRKCQIQKKPTLFKINLNDLLSEFVIFITFHKNLDITSVHILKLYSSYAHPFSCAIYL